MLSFQNENLRGFFVKNRQSDAPPPGSYIKKPAAVPDRRGVRSVQSSPASKPSEMALRNCISTRLLFCRRQTAVT